MVPFPPEKGDRLQSAGQCQTLRGRKAFIKEKYGIYLVDSFGNRELIYSDPNISCLDPIPLRPRPRPPVLPIRTKQMAADRTGGEDLSAGIVSVMNVYEGGVPIPDGVKTKEMRVISFFPKSTFAINNPRIGHADQSLARGVLGTVPVEKDGSVHFECPTGTGIAFQLLDENGMMVQNMHSDTYLHPGENKRSYSLPMQEGARVSKLWKKLEAAGAREKLSAEDLRRITLWLDCNSNFYGAYKETEKQARGGVVLPKYGLPKWSDPEEFIH